MTEPNFSYSDDTQPLLTRKTIQLIEKATGQPRLHRLYTDNRNFPVPGESFWQAAVRKLELVPTFNANDLANIPATGPVVVIANHPYGVLDGLVICWLIEKVRKDFLVLTHSVLLRAPEARANLLAVDFTGTEDALKNNLETRDAARKHLAAGGCVVVFPAGAVSTAPDRFGRRKAIDWPWQPFTAQLIQRAKATVVPVFFGGQNSRLFQIASHISPTLRLSLIFKEVHDRIGSRLPLVIGEPVSPEAVARYPDRKALLDDLRDRTYALEARLPVAVRKPTFRPRPPAVIVHRVKRALAVINAKHAQARRSRRQA